MYIKYFNTQNTISNYLLFCNYLSVQQQKSTKLILLYEEITGYSKPPDLCLIQQGTS